MSNGGTPEFSSISPQGPAPSEWVASQVWPKILGDHKLNPHSCNSHVFEQTSPVVEDAGVWYCPIFAALITAAGRLLLTLLERMVTDAGGKFLLCDTDSMAVVASKDGGLVPCAGGGQRLPDGSAAINALSWADVDRFVSQIDQLNPYNRSDVTDPILKIEKINFNPDGTQREVWGYAIAAKRYALCTKDEDGAI